MKYQPSETIADFMLSEAEVKCIVGPLGCLPGYTEYLTPEGWKRIDSYETGDLVANWDPNTGYVSYAEPEEHQVLPATQWVHIRRKTGTLDLVMSDDHRMPVWAEKNDALGRRFEFEARTSLEIAELKNRQRLVSTYSVPSRSATFPSALIRYAVAVNADGCLPLDSPKAVVFSFRKRRKTDRMRELLDEMRVPYNQHVYYRNGQEEHQIRVPDSPYRDKTFDNFFFWAMGGSELSVVVDELVHWDGHMKGTSGHGKNLLVMDTAREPDVGFLQFAGNACGYRTTVETVVYENPDRSVLQRVKFIPQTSRKFPLTLTRQSADVDIQDAKKGELKYCFTTRTGYFLIRSGGQVLVSHNSGKSMGGLMEFFRRMVQQDPDANGVRPTRFVIVRNTASQLRETVLSDAKQYFGDFFEHKVSTQTMEFRFELADGTRVESDWLLIPLERPEDQRKLLSLNITSALIEECREVNYDVVAAVRGRIGRYPSQARVKPTWQALMLISNPWSVSSDYHTNLVLRRPQTWDFFHQPGGMDPHAENKQFLPDNYYNKLLEGNTQEWVNVHVHSQFGEDMFGSAVYKAAFDYERHVVRDLESNPQLPIVLGMDFGRTPCAIVTQEDIFGRLLALHEVTSEDMGLHMFLHDKLIPFLNTHYASHKVFVMGDPAGVAAGQYYEGTAFSVLREAGLEALPAPSNNPEVRIQAVEKRLVQNAGKTASFMVSETGCPKLLEGFARGYRYKKQRNGDIIPVPEKNDFSHIHDAMQYAALGHQGSFIAKRLMRRQARAAVKPKRVPKEAWT